MPSETTIDLSTLPAPTILAVTSFEAILADMLADLISRDPTFSALVESDPAYKILEVCAYRETLKTQQFNTLVVAGMLAYASGTDLDNLAATYVVGVYRLGTPATLNLGAGASGVVLTADITPEANAVSGNGISIALVAPSGAYTPLSISVTGQAIVVTLASDMSGSLTTTAGQLMAALNDSPAVSALVTTTLAGDGTGLMALSSPVFLTGGVNELDGPFRTRIQLSPNGFSCAGPKGAYEFFTLSVPGVADVSVQGTNDDDTIPPGTVVICVLGSSGTGALADPDTATDGEDGESAVLVAVRAALNAQDVRPLTDTVHVQAAAIVNYAIAASIYTYSGPDPTTVIAAAQAAATAFAAARHKIGESVTKAAINAALFQAGVQNVILTSPASDVAITDYQFSNCTGITLIFAGIAE